MYTSTSSLSSSSFGGFGGPLLQGGSSVLSEYSTPAVSDTPDEVASGFARLLEDYQSVSADPRSVRKAACCAALAETAREQRGTRGSRLRGEDDGDDAPVTPNEMFVVVIAALTSLQTSIESRQKSLSSSSSCSSGGADRDPHAPSPEAVAESIARELEGTALPVLELLRRVLPYVAHRSNNSGAMLSHQFGTISRMLRLFVALGYALPAASAVGGGGDGSQRKKKRGKHSSSSPQQGEGGAAVAGANALLRQVLRVSTTLLLVAPPGGGVAEKDLARLLHATIVPMFHDHRPKVRKAAWGCGMEIVVVASSSSSSSLGGDIETNDDDGIVAVARGRVQRQRRAVADFLWEYCHAVVANLTTPGGKSKKEASSRVTHVLRFLSNSLPYADDGRIRVRFGEICIATLAGGGGGGGSGETASSVEVVRETLVVLLSCLEATEREQELRDDCAPAAAASAAGVRGDEEISKFAARCLASLLQYRPNGGANGPDSHNGGDDVSSVYGRCLLACTERMLGGTTDARKDGSVENGEGVDQSDNVPAPKSLAMKLIPNVLASMLNICEASGGGVGAERGGGGGGEIDDGSDRYDACGSAFNQFVSRVIPVVVSHLDRRETKSATLHRLSLETLPLCIPIVKRALQIQCRSSWGSILSGGYAKFTLTLARHLLEATPMPSSDAEFRDQVSSWVRTLVLSLLRLHDDVAKGGGAARTAVEYATSTIIHGMGVESFLGVVDFVDEDGDGGGVVTKKKSMSSSSTTTGGGIREDRAWLLPLMKQSAAGTGSRNAAADDITSRTHLSFFQGNVLNLARKCDAASADGHRTAAESSIQKARVVELWSLFPMFCVYPLDVKENFGSVAKIVVKALGDHGRYPKLVVSAMRFVFLLCVRT